ncbi:MAG: cell division protein FtsH, partial [Sulfurovum sp.]|nr:cell division protein FtsH [Sulfurovum sp.]
YQKGEEHVFLGREMAMPKDFSEATAKLIDDEVRKIITQKEEQIMKLFSKHKEEIIALSDRLVEKELMTVDEIRSLIHL